MPGRSTSALKCTLLRERRRGTRLSARSVHKSFVYRSKRFSGDIAQRLLAISEKVSNVLHFLEALRKNDNPNVRITNRYCIDVFM